MRDRAPNMPPGMVMISFVGYGDDRFVEVDGQRVGPEYFGFNDDELFREWLRHLGSPRCGGSAKSGKRCNSTPGDFAYSPGDFKRRHRVDRRFTTCTEKGETGAFRHVLDGGCVRLLPRAFKWRGAGGVIASCLAQPLSHCEKTKWHMPPHMRRRY
jgi:hypothetical protein